MNNLNSLEGVNYQQYFMAKVVANDDPTKKQRIKVIIPMLLDEDTPNLPWVGMITDPDLGYGTNYGRMSVPVVGSWVVVRFENGQLTYGQCIGSMPQQETQLPDLEVNYPNRYGFRDPAGNQFYVDLTPGSMTLEFKHKSGTKIEVVDNGAVNITSVSDVNVDVTGNVTTSVSGNMDATIGGNLSASIGGNANFSVSGSITSSAASWNHTGAMNLLGNLAVTGNIGATGNIIDTTGSNSKTMANIRSTYNTHTHPETGDGGGTTLVPNQTI
jgi:phage gp45-like